MILFRKIVILLLFTTVCLVLIAFGIYGYRMVLEAQSMEQAALKYNAERFLFISLVAAAAVFLLAAVAFYRGIRVDKELDKIIELNRYQDFSPKRNMEKLGMLGDKITELYRRLNTLGEYKTLKISALTVLNSFLIENVHLPLLITDVRGTILQATEEIAEKLRSGKSEMINSLITDFVPEMKMQNVVFEVNKARGSIEGNAGKNTFSCYPVYNRNNELSYLVFNLGKQAAYPSKKESNFAVSDRKQSVQDRIQSKIAGFLGRGKKKKTNGND